MWNFWFHSGQSLSHCWQFAHKSPSLRKRNSWETQKQRKSFHRNMKLLWMIKWLTDSSHITWVRSPDLHAIFVKVSITVVTSATLITVSISLISLGLWVAGWWKTGHYEVALWSLLTIPHNNLEIVWSVCSSQLFRFSQCEGVDFWGLIVCKRNTSQNSVFEPFE